jgi:hypothetical protein
MQELFGDNQREATKDKTARPAGIISQANVAMPWSCCDSYGYGKDHVVPVLGCDTGSSVDFAKRLPSRKSSSANQQQ